MTFSSAVLALAGASAGRARAASVPMTPARAGASTPSGDPVGVRKARTTAMARPEAVLDVLTAT